MRAVIFANGSLNAKDWITNLIQPGDLLIAADGGSRHCLALGLMPQVLIGDMDSLSEAEFAAIQAGGAKVVRHPARKDYTDLELALQYAKDQGASEVLVLAALGQRWDQTLANLLLPAAAPLARLRISLVDGPQEILLIRPGESLEVRGEPGDTVSLIPLLGDAHGVATQGLEYPLHRESLLFGATRGISNVLLGTTATVNLEQGLLVCVVIHQGEGNQG